MPPDETYASLYGRTWRPVWPGHNFSGPEHRHAQLERPERGQADGWLANTTFVRQVFRASLTWIKGAQSQLLVWG